MNARQEFGQVRAELSGGTGDTHSGDDVDEGIGNLAKKLHAGLGGGGSNEGNVRETTENVRPATHFAHRMQSKRTQRWRKDL